MINTLEHRFGIEVGSEISRVRDKANVALKKYQHVVENAKQNAKEKAKDAHYKAKVATEKAKMHIKSKHPIPDLEKLPDGTLQVMVSFIFQLAIFQDVRRVFIKLLCLRYTIKSKM